jgi:hypothetical protein
LGDSPSTGGFRELIHHSCLSASIVPHIKVRTAQKLISQMCAGVCWPQDRGPWKAHLKHIVPGHSNNVQLPHRQTEASIQKIKQIRGAGTLIGSLARTRSGKSASLNKCKKFLRRVSFLEIICAGCDWQAVQNNPGWAEAE